MTITATRVAMVQGLTITPKKPDQSPGNNFRLSVVKNGGQPL